MAIDWVYTGAAMQGWGSLIQAAAAGGLLWVGWRGVDAWKREAAHQRETELGDAVLVNCYQAADVLRDMARRRGYKHVRIDIPKNDWESNWLWHTRENLAVAEHIYSSNIAAFQALRLQRHKAQAVLTDGQAKKLDAFNDIANWLIMNANLAVFEAIDIDSIEQDKKAGREYDAEVLRDCKARLEEHRQILGIRSLQRDPDAPPHPVDVRIAAAIKAVEDVFKAGAPRTPL
jgi:hypothetical protein